MAYDPDKHEDLLAAFNDIDVRLRSLRLARDNQDPDFSKDDYRDAWFEWHDRHAELSEMVALLDPQI